MRADNPWIEPSVTIFTSWKRSRSLLFFTRACSRGTPSAGEIDVAAKAGNRRNGKSSEAVALKYPSTVLSGRSL